MLSEQTEAAASQLEEVKTTVRDGLRNARRSIWDLRANEDDQTLPVRAKRAAEQLAGTAAVRFEVTGSYRALSPHIEEEVVNIMKEAVRNAVRHAGTSEITVLFQYRPQEFVMMVRDSGPGFDVDAPVPGHFGLRGMQERAQSINATFQVQSAPIGGTCVTLVSAYRQER